MYCLHLHPFEDPHGAWFCDRMAWEHGIFKSPGAIPAVSFSYIGSFRSAVNAFLPLLVSLPLLGLGSAHWLGWNEIDNDVIILSSLSLHITRAILGAACLAPYRCKEQASGLSGEPAESCSSQQLSRFLGWVLIVDESRAHPRLLEGYDLSGCLLEISKDGKGGASAGADLGCSPV